MEIKQFLRNKTLRDRYYGRGGVYLILLESCSATCDNMPGVKIGKTQCFTQRLVSYAKLYKGSRIVALCAIPRHNAGARITAFEARTLQSLAEKHNISPVFQREWFGQGHYSTIKNVLLTLHRRDFPRLSRWVRNTSNHGFDKRFHKESHGFEDDSAARNCHQGQGDAPETGFYVEDEDVICFQTRGRCGHETQRTIIRPQRDYLNI
jgi:hypothetical protein